MRVAISSNVKQIEQRAAFIAPWKTAQLMKVPVVCSLVPPGRIIKFSIDEEGILRDMLGKAFDYKNMYNHFSYWTPGDQKHWQEWLQTMQRLAKELGSELSIKVISPKFFSLQYKEQRAMSEDSAATVTTTKWLQKHRIVVDSILVDDVPISYIDYLKLVPSNLRVCANVYKNIEHAANGECVVRPGSFVLRVQELDCKDEPLDVTYIKIMPKNPVVQKILNERKTLLNGYLYLYTMKRILSENQLVYAKEENVSKRFNMFIKDAVSYLRDQIERVYKTKMASSYTYTYDVIHQDVVPAIFRIHDDVVAYVKSIPELMHDFKEAVTNDNAAV